MLGWFIWRMFMDLGLLLGKLMMLMEKYYHITDATPWSFGIGWHWPSRDMTIPDKAAPRKKNISQVSTLTPPKTSLNSSWTPSRPNSPMNHLNHLPSRPPIFGPLEAASVPVLTYSASCWPLPPTCWYAIHALALKLEETWIFQHKRGSDSALNINET